eukprot:scaffold62118_cov21-Prasinocladus_malaysianus.AAC.1
MIAFLHLPWAQNGGSHWRKAYSSIVASGVGVRAGGIMQAADASNLKRNIQVRAVECASSKVIITS